MVINDVVMPRTATVPSTNTAVKPATNSSAAPARVLMAATRQRAKAGGLIPRGTVPVPDVGSMDVDFVRTMLRDARSVPAPSLEAVPAGATDLRLFRVWITGGANNLVLSGPAR